MTKQRMTTIIFGLALFTFIAISVPHLAWGFHSFEADGTGSWVDYAWWVLSYGEALGIDVLIFWLTVVQTTEHRTKGGIIWVFTILLCVWSWYFNYLYTIDHAPNSSTWAKTLFGTSLTAGGLTPYLVSAIPLFILCYKYIHAQLAHGTPESVEQLAARVADMEQRKGYEQQLSDLQAGKFTGFIKRGISGGADIMKHTVNTARGETEQQPERKPRTANRKRRTPNTEHRTVSPEQRTANSEQQEVNSEQPEPNTEQGEPNTGPIPIRREQRTPNSEQRTPNSKEKVAALLADNQNISLAQISNQVGISRTRASELRSEILREASGQ